MSLLEMVKWPEHHETIREDELFMFAYCCYRWLDDPYGQRSPQQYSDLVNRLNTVFGDRYGGYTIDGIELYVRRVRTDPKYRWPATTHKRYNQFSGDIKQYLKDYKSAFGPGAPPARAPSYAQKRMPSLPRTSSPLPLLHRSTSLFGSEKLKVSDVIHRLRTMGDDDRLTLIAEFTDAYGPLLHRSIARRSTKYESELVNRLLTAAVAIFGGDRDRTMTLLQRTQFVANMMRPTKRYVRSVSVVIRASTRLFSASPRPLLISSGDECRSINIKARKDARNRMRRSFLVTAATRFFISGLNRSQWDRDRKLRTKGMGGSGLPLRSLLSLGYGVKGPADVTSKQITTAPVPDSLNVGVYRDRLAGKKRDYDQEGRAQIRDLRSILTAHMTAVVALGMVRTDEPIHPDRLMFGDAKGAVHEAHYVTPITVYFRLTDDNATLARFSLFQMPMFSVSVQLMDDLDVFHRGFSNLITRPQLLLLAFERELTSSSREYGTTLRTALESACAAPMLIPLNDHHVCCAAVTTSRRRRCAHQRLALTFSLVSILVLPRFTLIPSLQDVRFQFKYFCSCGDGRSQQIGAGNMQSNSHYRCWLCAVPSHKYRALTRCHTSTAHDPRSFTPLTPCVPFPSHVHSVTDGGTATYRHWTIPM
jgi:hypothetical protein